MRRTGTTGTGTYRFLLVVVSIMEASVPMVTGSDNNDVIQVTQDGSSSAPHVACEGKPLRFADPFDPSWIYDEDFMVLDWKGRNATGAPLSFMGVTHRNGKTKYYPAQDRVSTYQFWGIQISDVRHEDSGLFQVTYLNNEHTKSRTFEKHVIVASPPTLKSDVIKMDVEEAERGKTRVTCGQLESLGRPPVDLVLKTGDGTVLHKDNAQGSIVLTLDKDIADVGELRCGINASSPATECIPTSNSTLFNDVIYNDVSNSASPSVLVLFSVKVVVLFLASWVQNRLSVSLF